MSRTFLLVTKVLICIYFDSDTWRWLLIVCLITQLTLENSNTQFFDLYDSSNKFFDSLNITYFFRQKCLDILNLDIWKILVGRTKQLDSWTISSRSLELSLHYFGQNSKVLKFEKFIGFFGKKIHHKSF